MDALVVIYFLGLFAALGAVFVRSFIRHKEGVPPNNPKDAFDVVVWPIALILLIAKRRA